MLVILNNKMYLKPQELSNYINSLSDIKNMCDFVVAPSFCFLPYFMNKFTLCGQDVSVMKDGPYTGEISSSYLHAFKVKYCLVNHYERVTHFNESINDSINKIINLQNNNIIPVICITLTNKEKIEDNLNIIDLICDKINMNKDIIISFETVEAITNNEYVSKDRVLFVTEFIKNYMINKYNKEIKVLYGGNINSDTIKEYKDINSLDGFIIGEKSVDIDELKKLFMEV